MSWWDNIQEEFYKSFIYDNRWTYLVSGLGNTLVITLFALLLGMALGFLVAYVRVTCDNTGRLRLLNRICRVYLSVIRGTPVVIQLMVIYYIILGSLQWKLLVAVLGFGINSGAYVAEIFRGGIMSIDPGQMEAGRSLGLSYKQTMWRIVMPQAVKNVLPALVNEFIVLLKETSVSGYIAITDLTRAGDIIRGISYVNTFPLLAVAAIYLVSVLTLEHFARKLERRLARSDRG